jgi:hypothetical protein
MLGDKYFKYQYIWKVSSVNTAVVVFPLSTVHGDHCTSLPIYGVEAEQNSLFMHLQCLDPINSTATIPNPG